MLGSRDRRGRAGQPDAGQGETRMSAGGKARMERTRKAILDAGEAVFLEHGFLGASMDQVAELAGVSKQTVYAHLQSKEALFLEVVGGMTGGAGDRLAEQVADPQVDRPLADFLLDFARQQLEIVLTPRLMRLRRLVIGEVGRFPDLGRMLHERGPGRSIARLARAFEAYRDAGHVAIPDPREAASHFNWLVMGGPVNAAMLLGDEAIPDKDDRLRHARECVRIFLAAYGAWDGSRLPPDPV